MRNKKRAGISVTEAVDNLSNLADLNPQETGRKEIQAWLDPKKSAENEAKIKETFHVLNHYLQHLYQRERSELTDPHMQRGIKAMMQLANEAAVKVQQYTEVFKGALNQEASLAEYEELKQFYLSKIVAKVEKASGQEAWEKEGEALTLEKRALKDLESVRRDGDYELFYISKEDGTSFFNPTLLRHLRMVGSFDETQGGEEDLLKQLDALQVRDYHVSAREILQETADLFDEFYKEALQHKEKEFIADLSKAAMALMLAANPEHLLSHARGKSCRDYFQDFQRFLRHGLQTEEYHRLVKAAHEKLEPFYRTALKLSHMLCGMLFLRNGAHEDILLFLQNQIKGEKGSGASHMLSEIDASIRSILKKHPSGPLLKVLESFRLHQGKIGFDPHLQNNAPAGRFTLASEAVHMTFVHLPAPVHQEYIDKVKVADEFKGYLRYLGGKKHLLINLQDRTSWKEYHRCLCLEGLSKKEESLPNIKVLSLAKNTDFYHQTQEYAALDDAAQFCAQLESQVQSGEQCGFSFPAAYRDGEKIRPLITLVHEQFFEKKKKLTLQERLDFIEIFYFFLVFQILELEQPDSVSFTCKDGIDTGAAELALFYGLTRMLSNSKAWSEGDQQFFLFSLYAPALLVRHRAPDAERFKRMFSALECFKSAMKTHRAPILKACAKVLPDLPIDDLKVA